MTDTNTTEATPIGTAIEKAADPPTGARAMVSRFEDSFVSVLPSHIRPASWIRLAQSSLRRGAVYDSGPNKGRYVLEVAADNDPGRFLAELLEAARLGLEPGTEQFYLTTRKDKGTPVIQGIVGYMGYVELMYRAGAVAAVICENVQENDEFVWRPGSLDTEMMAKGQPLRWQGPQRQPFHDINWRGSRGGLVLTYAYAVMAEGNAISKVVVLNEEDIDAIKKRSPSYGGKHSPWHTDEGAMWLKSGIRRLRKWVPTSPEYRTELLRATAAAEDQRTALELPTPLTGEDTYADNGDVDDDTVDAELVEDELDTPAVAAGSQPTTAGQQDGQPASSGRGARRGGNSGRRSTATTTEPPAPPHPADTAPKAADPAKPAASELFEGDDGRMYDRDGNDHGPAPAKGKS